ncbi:MAG: hypothetical protein PHH75_02765 [Candidatus Omnitrophica bacterium]|nr:hypothetical protein [Candidatus Omnitrophota bacterium]MDD5574081.1 hypothetical protein [Candidatus Omnitrophota bacterium]
MSSLNSPIAAWERAGGFSQNLRSLVAVVAALLLRPAVFFRDLKSSGGLPVRRRVIRAVIFALILGYLKLALDTANIVWLKHFSSQIAFPELRTQMSLLSLTALRSPFFILRPVLALGLTFLFVSAGVKMILGFDKSVYPVIFVVCYKSAADLFYALPLAGGLFASVWAMALVLVGVRELYGLAVWRAIMSAVVLPFIFVFFLALSVGPSVNRALVRFYPELRGQVLKLNDLTGYMYTLAIVNAAKTYKQELGFYPANLDVLKKYMPRSVVDDVADSDNTSGYVYTYEKRQDDHFEVMAHPARMNVSGRFVFYSDEKGLLHLGGPAGPVIQGTQDLEPYWIQAGQAPGAP